MNSSQSGLAEGWLLALVILEMLMLLLLILFFSSSGTVIVCPVQLLAGEKEFALHSTLVWCFVMHLVSVMVVKVT